MTAKVEKAVADVGEEFASASSKFKPFNSAHEGYAVLLEEVDELWDEVKKKPSARSKQRMYDEAKQIAAMAIRFMVDVCDDFKPLKTICVMCNSLCVPGERHACTGAAFSSAQSHTSESCPRKIYGCGEKCTEHACRCPL